MRNILWLGAHKTGTTFLQKSLDLTRPTLHKHQVRYMPLERFRKRYTRPLLDGPSETPPSDKPFPFRANTNLIFDENIPGYVQHALSAKGFYPDMIERIDRIIDHLEFEVHEVIFGVRDYGGYLPSLYCECLKSTPFREWEDFLKHSFRRPSQLGPSDRYERANWHDLLGRLADRFPDATIRSYLYEDLRGAETELLSAVLRIPADEFQLITTNERVGFSGEAVRQLHELAKTRDVATKDVRQAARSYPTGQGYTSFSPWSDDRRRELTEQYQSHCNDIRADRRIEIIPLMTR